MYESKIRVEDCILALCVIQIFVLQEYNSFIKHEGHGNVI